MKTWDIPLVTDHHKQCKRKMGNWEKCILYYRQRCIFMNSIVSPKDSKKLRKKKIKKWARYIHKHSSGKKKTALNI